MRVVLSQTEKEMNVNNTKITAPINQLILSLLVREYSMVPNKRGVRITV